MIHDTRMNFRNLFALTEFDQEDETVLGNSCHRNQIFDEIQVNLSKTDFGQIERIVTSLRASETMYYMPVSSLF